MRLIFTIFGVIFLLVVLISAAIGGLLYFSPQIIAKIATSKPTDLGIRVDERTMQDVYQKASVNAIPIRAEENPTSSRQLIGSQDSVLNFTSEQMTAMAKLLSRWRDYPFTDVQVKINKDNSVEISGIINTSSAIKYAIQLGYSETEINDVMKKYNIPTMNLPFYIHGQGSVTNNRAQGSISNLKLAQIPVPSTILTQNMSQLQEFVNQAMDKSPGFYANSLTVSDEMVHFIGKTAKEDRYIAR